MPNALDMSKNSARIYFGGSQSKFEKNSLFIDRSWFIPELNGRKPDFSIKQFILINVFKKKVKYQ